MTASWRRVFLMWAVLAASSLGLAGCHGRRAPAPTLSPWLQDVTAQIRLDFVQTPGPSNRFFMPDEMGTGAALLDYDNDGRLDLLLLQGGGPHSGATNKLYHQETDGRFTDVTAGSGLGFSGCNLGAAVGDINNDGLSDVLICSYGSVRLFLNVGGGKFRDITRAAGISDPHWAVSASFFDYDRDGRLDLVIVNYVNYEDKPCQDPSGQPDYCAPAAFAGSASQLYHNVGDKQHVRFADVSLASGLGRAIGAGLGVATVDFNGDDWPDIFITQDGEPNRLWINQHNGTFQDKAPMSGIAVNSAGASQANMGIGLGDLDGSGLPSAYVTHLTEEGNTLWMPISPGLYTDSTAQAGLATVSRRGTGFGIVMTDLDNDGFPDVAVVNGRVRHMQFGPQETQTVPGLGPHWSQYAETNQLFANDGQGKFRDISAANASFCGTLNVGRGLTCGDIFNDGGQDLLVTSIHGPARLYRDVAARRGHWLEVRTIDPRFGGRDAYGARVTVTAAGRRHVAWITPAYSLMCSNDPRAHFGLGPSDHIEAISVHWPDGKTEVFPPTPADQIVTLRRGAGY